MTGTDSITKLKEFFVKAGFFDAIALMTDISIIPDRVFILHNSYALVVGYAASAEESETGFSLMEVKEKMHTFIRQTLLELENEKGLIVDGYLLIALNQKPSTEVKDTVRDIELDTKVCRKHVVWPSACEDGLDRLQYITILSLPEPLNGNAENTTSFELSTEASTLLTKYEDAGSLDRLMDAIKNGELADAN